jgi:hypothetical protein
VNFLWEKPFQNMRSTRATELIRTEPAHIVNAIMGHTEAVAEAHYRQVTEEHFERAAAKKIVPILSPEHAGNALQGAEAKKAQTPKTLVIKGLQIYANPYQIIS